MRIDASSFIAMVAAQYAATMTRGLSRVDGPFAVSTRPYLAKTKKA